MPSISIDISYRASFIYGPWMSGFEDITEWSQLRLSLVAIVVILYSLLRIIVVWWGRKNRPKSRSAHAKLIQGSPLCQWPCEKPACQKRTDQIPSRVVGGFGCHHQHPPLPRHLGCSGHTFTAQSRRTSPATYTSERVAATAHTNSAAPCNYS